MYTYFWTITKQASKDLVFQVVNLIQTEAVNRRRKVYYFRLVQNQSPSTVYLNS